MQPRDRPIDLFSTFAILENDWFRRWAIDSRLRVSMQRHLTTQPDTTPRVWAIYWHRQWLTHPLARNHLSAYLQEPCFWVAQEMTRRLHTSQFGLADYFQIANGEIHRVLKSFQPDRSNNLRTYATLVLSNTLKDILRQRQAADMCSDWTLLRKTSKKRVGEVLIDRGFSEPILSEYRLAWFCFKTIYTPSDNEGRQLPQPSSSVWQQIAALYARQSGSDVVLTAAQIETRLIQLAQWTRSYLYPPIDSLNRPKPEAGELLDDLGDPIDESLLDRAIATEESQQRAMQRSQLQATLDRSLSDLKPELHEIFRLFYRDGLSQQELADRLNISQPTISRRIKQAEAQLLAALVRWSESQLHKFPDPNELKVIGMTLKEWLTESLGGKG
jgi:RNA polymerase sigma factor (sigma-70 family)